MKIVLICTSERSGGAAIACNRLMKAFTNCGMDAKMLVRDKTSDDPNVVSINRSWITGKKNYFRFVWERVVILLNNRFCRSNLFKVSIANTGVDISNHPFIKEADIIHIHWINQGFLSLKTIEKIIRTGKPIVWTMHDMWLFTGICHHAWGCNKYTGHCGCCPFLNSADKHDLSHKVFTKKEFLSETNIQIVAVSTWLKNLAEKSPLTKTLNISVIPNVIDDSVFLPLDKQLARSKHSLPEKKKIILMGAAKLNDPIKGFDYLRQALTLLKEKRDDLLLVLFGQIKNDDSFLSNLDVEYVYMGLIEDMSVIVQLYSAADVTIVPSHYETFGQTLIESMSCGCPVISFDNSGQSDIIDHKINGYLAKYQDINDLAHGIHWILYEADYASLSTNARDKAVNNYNRKVVANQYIELYKRLG